MKSIFLCALLYVLLNGTMQAYQLSAEKKAILNQTLQSWVDSFKYAGIINLTSFHGTIDHFEAFGFRDLESRAPLKTDTLVRIYSMTKPIVSVAIMQLVEQGKLSLDDPITDHFPEFKKLQVYEAGRTVVPERPITLKHLLTHTAGFSYGWSEHPVDQAYQDIRLLKNTRSSEEFVQKVSKLPLIYHPGEKWHYSIAVDLQGILIERVSKMSLGKYLKKEFFEPLGMKDTSFHVPRSKKSRFSSNYRNIDGKLKIEDSFRTSTYYNKKAFQSGGGGLVSTASDYYQFARMLLNGGELNGKRFLKKATLDLMIKDQLGDILENPEDPWTEHSFGLEDSKFGLGFRLTVINDPETGAETTHQYSWNGAAGTEFWIDPLKKLINITLIQKMDSDWLLRENMEQLIY